MVNTGSQPDSGALPDGRSQGRRAFAEAVRRVLAVAAREGWPQLVLSDPDFTDWPLGERAVIESLQAWAGHGRQIRFLACDFEPLRRQHPRLVQWRVLWSHLVDAHAVTGSAAAELPSALWSPGWSMERIDPVRSVLLAGQDAVRRVALRERLDACWQRGSPSFAATTLGL